MRLEVRVISQTSIGSRAGGVSVRAVRSLKCSVTFSSSSSSGRSPTTTTAHVVGPVPVVVEGPQRIGCGGFDLFGISNNEVTFIRSASHVHLVEFVGDDAVNGFQSAGAVRPRTTPRSSVTADGSRVAADGHWASTSKAAFWRAFIGCGRRKDVDGFVEAGVGVDFGSELDAESLKLCC